MASEGKTAKPQPMAARAKATNTMRTRRRRRGSEPTLLDIAVSGIVALVIVVAVIAFVATGALHIGLVEDEAEQAVVDAGGGGKRALHKVGPGAAPLDHEQIRIDDAGGVAHVDHRRERRQVDEHVVVARAQAGHELLHAIGAQDLVAVEQPRRGACRQERHPGSGVDPDDVFEPRVAGSNVEHTHVRLRRKPARQRGIAQVAVHQDHARTGMSDQLRDIGADGRLALVRQRRRNADHPRRLGNPMQVGRDLDGTNGFSEARERLIDDMP